MKMYKVEDSEFCQYGRILTKDYDVSELILKMEKTPAPSDVIYFPSIAELEELPIAKIVQDSIFGGLPIQIGYCNGTNSKLNAVEYHRNSEIGVACTDLILLLGKQQDITEDYKYDTSKVEAFFVKKGEVVEMYATTLHYAPCSVDEKPFRNVVILPKGTNTELESIPKGAKEDPLLVATNKWLIAHADAKIKGAVNGLIGENISVK
jgi:hypothetical protein